MSLQANVQGGGEAYQHEFDGCRYRKAREIFAGS